MKRVLRVLAAWVLTVTCYHSFAQNELWKAATSNYDSYFNRDNPAVSLPADYKLYTLDAAVFKNMLGGIPKFIDGSVTPGIPFQIPMPDGNYFNTLIAEVNIWADAANADKAQTKTYRLINPVTREIDGSVSVLNGGVTAILFTKEGTAYMHPLNVDGTNTHVVYYTRDSKKGSDLTCGVDEALTGIDGLGSKPMAGDCRRRNYRLAVAATGEYYNWAGGVTQAWNYITITINTVNAIYLRDLGVSFLLVQDDDIIFTNPSTDPYTTGTSLNGTFLNNNQTAIDANVGSSNYDVGIAFSSAFSGGLAQLQSACANSEKARAGAGYQGGTGANPNPGPQGQWFDGAVAHELGHMFGATHTFSATNGSCGSNITLSTAWEPGSGSTIMAYAAAGCGNTNSIQMYQDYYFHGGSIGQMQNYIIGQTGTCGNPTITANVAPIITSAGTSFTIPKSTPFMLTLNAFDANNNAMSYTWEQMDANFSSATPPSASQTQGPLFRSWPPSNIPTRYFPRLQTLLAGATSSQYEVLPSVSRNMNFRGTVRDNSTLGGCTDEEDVTVTVTAGAGPFAITSQWGPETWTANGTNTVTITWDVMGTNAPPVNAATVDILFSTDGGMNYTVILAAGTPNDGSHTVTVPAVSTTSGRIMVKPTNNIFFAINDAPITVNNTTPVTFLGITATKEGTGVAIRWSTATEQNSDRFIVERSVNGTEFNEVATVKAAGNSTAVLNYKANDARPNNGVNYYRIKQIDVDGKFMYSKVVSVNYNTDAITLSVYPNPAKEQVSVDFSTERAGRVRLEVYDSRGALVLSNSVNAVAGNNKSSLNIAALSKGVYVIKCSTDANSTVTRFVKE